MKKRKLTVESLAELAKRMPVLSESMQSAYVGGLDPNDCWWRCMAYLKNCNPNPTAEEAMAIASGYYGDNFNENSYAFSGNYNDAKQAVSGTVTGSGESYCSGQILVFNPNNVAGWSGNGTSSHAVVITDFTTDYYEVYDPQNQTTSRIKRSELVSGAFIVTVR